MGHIFDQVRTEILLAIKNDDLVLPTLPEVALQVRDVAMNPDASMEDLTKVIGNDPSLSARVIKVANSPLMRASRKIEDLQSALSRLGMSYTCNIATGLAMEQMFQATSDLIDSRLRETWNRSAEVAGIATVLCRFCTKLRPDQATLAGLVHQIGALPILTFAENHKALLRDAFTLDTVIEKLAPAIGNRILGSWDFPDEIRQVPSEHLAFTAEKPKVDYADIVTVALINSYAGTNHPYARMDHSKVTAFKRLGIDPETQDFVPPQVLDDLTVAKDMLK
ncbi:HDOD domain-containing protein [Halioxenophilus aromaticivorans]|uniref:HDOD domain-containing protein n=1 Tax=Halioxenophilus aromaticivorans TaxID=1306992 RepID=A0AAV3TW18_9ALTE